MHGFHFDDWKECSSGKSLAFFARKKNCFISREMVSELKRISKQNGGVNARFCLHSDPGENLQDMVVLAYRDKICRKLHKHTSSNEAIQMIEGCVLALIFDENQRLVDKRVLDDQNEFAYRNNHNLYHLYLPLTEYAILRETRDGKNEPGETVEPAWDSVAVVKKYIPPEYQHCLNEACREACCLRKQV